MNCNFNTNCQCNNCSNFVKTTDVAVVGGNLVLTIPSMSLCNCKNLCLMIAQTIPNTITTNTKVVIQIGTGGISYSIITPCCANNLYADQLNFGKTYSFKFGTDTLFFIYKGGWRLCKTAHIFNCIPLPVVVENVAEVNINGKILKSNAVIAKE